MYKNKNSASYSHFVLLFLCILIGTGLRLTNLTAKPPWIDEFATFVFSLGNTFQTVPLDRVITIDTLLQPLQINSLASINDVIHNITAQDTHPPLYFVLAHLWMHLFKSDDGLLNLWAARSLPAILGGLSIGAIYGLSWVAFRSNIISNLAAALMAFSPYGIFISQEARHYSLAILWVTLSLTCFVLAVRRIQEDKPLSIWVAISWVVINACGFATHYFFSLTLATEVIILVFIKWYQFYLFDNKLKIKQSKIITFLIYKTFSPPWGKIYAVAIGTFASGLVWLPLFLQNKNTGNLTAWIQGDRSGITWISPIFQSLAAWITMISLLPVESSNLVIIILSGLVMLIFFIWALPILISGYKSLLKEPASSFIIRVFWGLFIAANAIFFIFTYLLNIDLTRGARYAFVYFPAFIVLIAACLKATWEMPSLSKNTLIGQQVSKQVNTRAGKSGITLDTKPDSKIDSKSLGKKAIYIVLTMGLLSGITVVSNLGYQKYYRPDLLIPIIENQSQAPALIASPQVSLVQIGEMMGIARELKTKKSPLQTSFLLAHEDGNPKSAEKSLNNALENSAKPLDLWAINFPLQENTINACVADEKQLPAIYGYNYKLYHCK
jgi:uncharacterized membrane protein